MKIEFDSKKSEKNALERELPFQLVEYFEWDTAIYEEDTRKLYPEQRFVAVGYLNSRLHVVCFTPIIEGIRVISFRKANSREVRSYEEAINE